MKTEKIEQLFSAYLAAFKTYELEKVAACYHLPCTLNTPDKVVLLTDEKVCQQAFSDIFTQLQQAQTTDIKARKASYSLITENLAVVCIDWDFLADQGELFADFCAIYHLTLVESEWKIINVVSHDLSNSLSLAVPFYLST